MSFAQIFRRTTSSTAAAEALYGAIVAKSRSPEFYVTRGVPDTVDGRFDMIIIHAMLLFRRLRGGEAAEKIGQQVFDFMFQDMDRSLREMGVGDLSVSRHIKKMAKAFYGRAEMYETGLDGEDAVLKEALVNNLYRKQPPDDDVLVNMATYIRSMASRLAGQEISDIVEGRLDLA